MALPCSLMSIAAFLLENWLKSFSADSKSLLTACRRSSRKMRSRRADDVLKSATRWLSSSIYAWAIAAARFGSWSVTPMAMIWLFRSTDNEV